MLSRRSLLASAALGPALAVTNVLAQDASPTPVPAATRERGIVYGTAGGQELLLDLYLPPPQPELQPAVITIHGGAWTEGYGSRNDFSQHAWGLVDAGYAVFNIDYRLLGSTADPQVWPAQLDDVQRAVRWVRANAATYGVDPEKIASYGISSGGHLAAFLGVRDTRDNSDPELASFSSRVQCVIDLAGDMDLSIPYPQSMDNKIVVNLLGGTIDDVPDAYLDASPLNWVNEQSAPFLILHGGSDSVNPVEHSRKMAEALRTAGVEIVFGEFPAYDHFEWLNYQSVGPWALPFLERLRTSAF